MEFFRSVVKVNEVQTLPIKDSRLKSQLLAMMEQLDAIEETAKHVQEEFKDSELVTMPKYFNSLLL